MSLYELQQADARDLLELISAPSLTIPANMAPRLTQLQMMLRQLAPSSEHEELKVAHAQLQAEHAAMCKQADELARQRDNALLEVGLERKRVHELEQLTKGEAMCANCLHPLRMHSNDSNGCSVATCACMDPQPSQARQ